MNPPPVHPTPRRPDAEDVNATVPVKGWNDASTIPLARPASGSEVNHDETVAADLNRHDHHPDADQAETAATRPAHHLGHEATLLADQAPDTRANDHAVLVQTRPTNGAPGGESGTPLGSSSLSSLSNSGALSRSYTRTGRTRVNLNLPAEAQQLDQKLQMSRTSVLSDMATARIGKGELPPGILKLIEAQGTEGRYAIDRPLAAGGMGAVLQINDHDFGRPAAMKVILSKYARNEEATERFLAEAQVTAQLEHPNIVPIHDLGVMDDGTLYFTMKLIEGMSFGRVVKLLQQQAGTLKDKDGVLIVANAESAAATVQWTMEEKLLAFLKVLDGVGFAHSRGVVHRDIKPDNIMLGTHGEVLVVDWGIAKILGSADPRSDLVRQVASLRDSHSASATMDGSAMGTLYYMPPEQALGHVTEVDARSDIYALGATLYELLALRRCMDHGNMADMVVKVANGAWTRLDAVAPHLHLDLIAVVHRAMARERAERYQSCADFAADLRRFLAGQAVHARRRNLIERIGLWYAAHRRQVQVAAAGVVLVTGAVGITLLVGQQADRAASRMLLAEAEKAYAGGLAAQDVTTLEGARLSLAKAATLDRDNRAIIELNTLVMMAIDQAKREERARAQREAAAQRAQALMQEARQQIAGNRLEDAAKTLDAALTLAPGDQNITALVKKVAADLGNENLRRATLQAREVRAAGDAVLARAEQLDRADLQVDTLLRQAEDLFAKAEAVVPVEGTQAQVRLVALLRQAAESARKTKEDVRKGEAAGSSARSALAARRFAEAKDAIAQALAFIPNRADLVALRDRILVEENQVVTAQQAALRLAQAEALGHTARTALAAGDLLAAREAAAQAWGLVPGHPPIDQLRLQISESERQAGAQARLTAIRAQAAAALNEAKQHRDQLQDAYRRHAAATAEVATLSEELAGRPAPQKGPLWQAYLQRQRALTAVSEQWSLTEAAAQSVLSFLNEDAANPLNAEAKGMLADLYQARLIDARHRRDVANVTAFANLLTRYDDGRYANLLKDLGRLSVVGPAGTRLRLSELEAGTDLRLVPVGTPREIILPAEPLLLKGGRYQLLAGDVVISVVVDASAPVALTWPATLPAIPGMELRYVPPLEGRPAFLLGEREVTTRMYDRFLHDPAIWPQVTAAWKAYFSSGEEDARLMRLVPREGGHTKWQYEADTVDEIPGVALTRLTMPHSLADLPVFSISRDDAEAFCAWLGKRSQLTVRLPTRAEWQSAAHGGDVRRAYPWGEVFDGSLTAGVWVGDGSRREAAVPVGTLTTDVGPFGHLDLAGNVREWVADRTRTHGAEVVGGAWAGDRAEEFRTTTVTSAQPHFTNPSIGFRILVEIP